MEPILIAVIAVAVLVVLGGAYFLTSQRRGKSVLEPPPFEEVTAPPREIVVEEASVAVKPEPVKPPSFRDRLGKARGLFGEYVGMVRGRDRIDQTTWDDLEEAM